VGGDVQSLAADPEIRSRFRFGSSSTTGQSDRTVGASPAQAVTAAVRARSRVGIALRQMILIGHSQGAFVKMQAISTGDQLWNAVSHWPLEELQLRDETRDLFRRGLFLEPLPMVSRVIFICTPHRGSYVAGRRALANITRRLLTLPFVLTG
jgi:predicted esterase